ncbi:cation:proton antiporter subunit C [Candidatus Spongiihabitans sp.]|uniref:cation:proton antiporter subunit C n=1 Tax=Candidatus Spongiihabitans sp. TaxID=3101308 RepID=UPI003C6F0AD6
MSAFETLFGGLPGLLNYWIAIALLVCGLIIVMDSRNLIKKLIGLNIFQSAVFLLFITMGKVSQGHPPILPSIMPAANVEGAISNFSNPLPHALILTAIVVGVATTAVGLALIVRIRRAYGTVHEDQIMDKPEVEPEIMP